MSNYFEPWHEYKNLYVRQLAFSIASPNLLNFIPNELNQKYDFSLQCSKTWQIHFYNYEQKLKQLDRDPTSLIKFLNQIKSTRLGFRFEAYLWFWLLDQNFHQYALLGHSIQKIEGAKTLGELDFLVKNTQENKIEHWEVALKYYLAEAPFHLPNWFGLNRNDTLEKKLSHFSHKQFQFNDALGYEIDTKIAVIKGQLYLPQNYTSLIPEWVNQERRLGYWNTKILPHYYRLKREEWITEDNVQTNLENVWWTNGLYKHPSKPLFYMYRIPPTNFLLNSI